MELHPPLRQGRVRILKGATVRVEWVEQRRGEPILVIAEKPARAWMFWERSSWETRWFLRVPDGPAARKASRLARGMTLSKNAAR
jgi:hypothetical protein